MKRMQIIIGAVAVASALTAVAVTSAATDKAERLALMEEAWVFDPFSLAAFEQNQPSSTNPQRGSTSQSNSKVYAASSGAQVLSTRPAYRPSRRSPYKPSRRRPFL